ncbi:SEC-C domain-containing protein [Longimicrobium sp.]|uniref:SEC-C domain-containing protein n=1 Tax=Longimicrobium sp. TaxID=2029185 RepID=UPI002E36057B|nr:SEC-C domain-containing protein [Longimicrobium sp.]HEX6038401.1 SEC-C domain-containing protein [Longimicrobium sp.]
MSAPHRNDPCPCGSGRKYKACHMRDDQAAARAMQAPGPRDIPSLRERMDEVARRTPLWQADVAPLMGVLPGSGEPGAITMVAADGLILATDVLSRRPVGVQARARAVMDVVMGAARSAGVLPERLHVRDAALARALRPEMERRGVATEAASLPELDEALDSALEHLADGPAGLGSAPWTWAETEATPAQLAELHAAAAAFHRAAPWRRLSDAEGLLLRFAGDKAPWAASVMGAASIHHGLALYSDPADLENLYDRDEPPTSDWAAAIQGFTLSMSYGGAAELPGPLRREVVRAGWEMAAPDVHPTLLGVRVPGRRITAELVERMAQACRAVVAFTSGDAHALPWRHPGTGVEVLAVFNPETEDERTPWRPLERSHPVGPAGPAADPAFVLRPDAAREAVNHTERARWYRFLEWLNTQSLSRAAHQREGRAAELWTEMLARMRVPAEAATEHELRFFLYGWLVMEQPPAKAVAKHLTRSLRRLFDWYAAEEGIEYPWATAVLEELDHLAAIARVDDVRVVLHALTDSLFEDLARRALVPETSVPGTVHGWSLPFDPRMVRLRDEMHRHWLLWHDEVVRGGITDPRSVRDVLVGRQREWENRPHPALDGGTPRQLVLEEDARAVARLSAGRLP